MDNVTIGLICTVGGLALGIFSAWNYSKKEAKEDTANSTEMKTMLSYIGKDVKDIKYNMRAQETRMGIIEERVTRVEESAKSAHHRINEMVGTKEKEE